jgi:hypothetical protein
MTTVRTSLLLTALAALVAVAPGFSATYPRLVGTVGFGTITLKDEQGRTVKTLKAGRYSLVVVDSTGTQNFHLRGTGINLYTGIAFKGTRAWTVTFRKGTTIKYFSDRAPKALRGSFTIRR